MGGILSALVASNSAQSVPLFIFIGESNSGGAATNTGLTSPDTDAKSQVKILNNTSLSFESLQIGTNNLIGHTGLTDNATYGWELGLANAVAAGRLNQSTVYLLKSGQGGSKVAQWAVGDGSGYWSTFLSRLSSARSGVASAGYRPSPVVFLSIGINDSISGTSTSSFSSGLNTIITNLQSELGSSTPIVITKFGTGAYGGAGYNSYNTTLDGISGTYIAKVETFEGPWQGDGNHWTGAGYKMVCERMIDAYLSIIGSSTSASPSISPATGAYSSAQTVTITGSGTIKYTTDGSPAVNGTVYSGSFTAPHPTTIKAVSVEQNKVSSAATSNTYRSSGANYWDSSLSGASSLDFINGDLTFTHSTASDSWVTGRGTVSKSSGLVYIEYKTDWGLQNTCLLGFMSSGASTATYLGAGAYGIGMYSGGNFANGFTVANNLSGGIAANDTVAFAIDFSAGKLWVAKNNTWVGSGDPAAGTNASATFTPGTVGALYPAISQYYKNLTGGRWTIKSTSDSQTYSPPSGFSAWG